MRIHYELDLEAGRVEVVLERRRGMRRFVMHRTGPAAVLVRVPARAARPAVDAFIRAHESWLRAQPCAGSEPPAGDGESIPAHIVDFGEKRPVSLCGFSGIDWVESSESGITVYTRRAPKAELCRRLLADFQRERLHACLAEFIETWSPKIGVSGITFRITGQKRRSGYLGKCFVNEKTVFFKNWLSFLPRAQIEYIVVHELCHFLEPSHSDRFKSLLTHFLPGWKALHDAAVLRR